MADDRVTRRSRVNAWVNRHAAASLLIVVCMGLAFGLFQLRVGDEHRSEDRLAGDRAYVHVLRQSCEDRNQRDARVLAGVKTIMRDLNAAPSTLKPLSDALAPRDCDKVYPMPTKGGLPRQAVTTSTTLPPPPFASCAEAAAAGLVPLHRGDIGYSTKLDRDRDGIACE